MNSEPATKPDLEEVKVELKADPGQLRVELKDTRDQLHSEAVHNYNDLVEQIRDSETELLKAFYSFAEANNKRIIQVLHPNTERGNPPTVARVRLAE
ncbi:MAG TPA: hypothetical protein VFW83_07625 [Bryobacteraceae bacterium]|nr:hypothetical protein [Bryobacteraceae bacterium]